MSQTAETETRDEVEPGDELDGCDLDFSAEPTSDEQISRMIAPPAGTKSMSEEEWEDAERTRGGDGAAPRGAGFDVGLAARLRAMGLRVQEVEGWRTRGSSSFHPRGAVTHHTAGAPRSAGKAPSLNIVTHGRSDLRGPLCNVYLDYEGTVYTVAAGSANHAGIPDGGSIKGMTGNSSAWGLEIEHPGTSPLEDDRAEIAARIQAACIKGTAGADMVVYHKEWAPSRKIDLATSPSPDAHRARVAHYLKEGGGGGGGAVSGTPFEAVPAWFWTWAFWFDCTKRDSPRPKAAPEKIPEWAWEMHKKIDLNGRSRGMSDGEQRWIVWFLAGQDPKKRPDVPDKIPALWWDDLEFVKKQREH